MTNKLKTVVVFLVVAGAIIIFYKFVLIRTVYYEIGGIKIPSRYNMLTGTVKPISNYKGKANLRTVEASKTNKMGLTEDEVIIAKFRWAVFEQWASRHPQYKGWQKSAVIFKKANDDFRKELEATGQSVKIIR